MTGNNANIGIPEAIPRENTLFDPQRSIARANKNT